MDTFFLKFNNEKIYEVVDFFNDYNNIMFLEAPEGANKNKILEYANLKTNEDILQFHHFCSGFTVLEDVLLSFYDTLRNYSVAQKIQLKKSMATGFTQKVVDYLKKLDRKSIITIYNFDKVMQNAEIVDFLTQLLHNPRIKIILCSKVDLEFWSFKNAFTRHKSVSIKNNSKEMFKLKTLMLLENTANEEAARLFDLTNGSELFLQMTISYLKTTETSISELFMEFDKQKTTFEDFIISRTMVLIPDSYVDFVKFMGIAEFLCPKNLVLEYKLSDFSQIEYLKKRLILSEIEAGYYIKDSLKKYFIERLTLGEKIKFGSKLIEIFEKELDKSPKERTLRLSREGIKKHIKFLSENVPKLSEKVPDSARVDIISHMQRSNNSWILNEPATPQIGLSVNSDDNLMLKKIRQADFEKNSFEQQVMKSDKISSVLEEAKKMSAEQNFDGAIKILKDFTLKNSNNELQAQVDILLGENFVQKNDLGEARNYYSKVADYYKNNAKHKEYYEFLLKIADINKILKYVEEAKGQYEKVIKNANVANDASVVRSYGALVDIYKEEKNEKKIVEIYEKMTQFAKMKENNKVLHKISYTLGSIYEKNDDPKNAIRCYLESIRTKVEDSFLPNACLNLALLYVDENERENAKRFLKLALSYFSKSNMADNSGSYWASINLAHLYKNENSELYKKYLDDALIFAKKTDDNFETANILVEIGDYYYYKKQNAISLVSYLRAKDVIKEPYNSQNMQMIYARIDDMRAKMNAMEFEKTVEEYEQNTN